MDAAQHHGFAKLPPNGDGKFDEASSLMMDIDAEDDSGVNVAFANDTSTNYTPDNSAFQSVIASYEEAFGDCSMALDDFAKTIVNTISTFNVFTTPVSAFEFLASDTARLVSEIHNAQEHMADVLARASKKGVEDSKLADQISGLGKWCELATVTMRKARNYLILMKFELDDALLACIVDELKANSMDLYQALDLVHAGGSRVSVLPLLQELAGVNRYY